MFIVDKDYYVKIVQDKNSKKVVACHKPAITVFNFSLKEILNIKVCRNIFPVSQISSIITILKLIP